MDYLSQYRGADVAFATLHRKGGLAAEAFQKQRTVPGEKNGCVRSPHPA